jgi:integrase/recombinase XerD
MIIYRRHVAPCDSTDRNDPRCGCPIHYEHRTNGTRVRRTLKTTNWQKAISDIRRKELEGFKESVKSPTIEHATDAYIKDATARELREPTLYKFRLLFKQLKAFAENEGLIYVSELNLDVLRRFRATWPNRNEAARVKLGNLKAFVGFCHKSKWLTENYAQDLKAGKVTDRKIIPLEPAELDKILKACEAPDVRTLKAMVLVLRYTGLRVRDVVTLERDAVRHARLFLRTAKTGTDVYCPLPLTVVEALAALPTTGRWYFWDGISKPKSAVGVYQKALQKVFKAAGVPRAHPHLFRHTYCTDLLQKGVSLQSVAVILGHSSTKITERRYSHWIKGRQENLEAELKKAWAQTDTPDSQSAPNR